MVVFSCYNEIMVKNVKPQQTLIKSFGHAWQGIVWIARHERNFQIHVMATLAASIMALLLRINALEWLILLLFLVLIPSLELLNTAVERTCDVVRDSMELDYEATKLPRDLAAGAVLYATLGAIIAGMVIFLPKLWQLLPAQM